MVKISNDSFKVSFKVGVFVSLDINGVKQTIPRYPRSNLLKASFGYTKAADAKPFKKNLEKDCYINTFSIKSWIMSPSVKEVVLEGIANTIINEFELPAQLGDVSDINIDPKELKLCSL